MRTILIALLMTLTTQVGAEEPLSRYVLVAYFQVDEKTPALAPAGVELRSDKEHLIWNQFTRAPRKIGAIWTLFCWLKS